MTRQEIEWLADEALDVAIKYIQDCLGVTTGDTASHVFSDGRVQRELAAYIAIEIGADPSRDPGRAGAPIGYHIGSAFVTPGICTTCNGPIDENEECRCP